MGTTQSLSKKSLGDRMKYYEGAEASRMFMPLLPVVARLDGRHFSSLTRRMGLAKPYDEGMMLTMQKTTEALVKETGAEIGYTQSDEITLIFVNDSLRSQIFFNGRIQKMVSVLASACTIQFYKNALQYMPSAQERMSPPMFDCRVYQTPNIAEAINALIWREQDATKNSIQSAARAYFSHKDCDDKDGSQLQEMLFSKGINWNNYPADFKRGSYFARRKFLKAFSEDEIAKLPAKHPAKIDPSFSVERTSVMKLDLPPMTGVLNKIGVLLKGEAPLFETPEEPAKPVKTSFGESQVLVQINGEEFRVRHNEGTITFSGVLDAFEESCGPISVDRRNLVLVWFKTQDSSSGKMVQGDALQVTDLQNAIYTSPLLYPTDFSFNILANG